MCQHKLCGPFIDGMKTYQKWFQSLKFITFLGGGACPQTPLADTSHAYIMYFSNAQLLLLDKSKIDSYGPSID